ncbi:MAG: hypothetical protein II628_08780 [Lachnospiraceae bacterium]|nr:hypothetical protein [Lachnospiraceae bacterium]
MIIDAREMEMDRGELLSELYVLSAKKEELARKISRAQQAVTDTVSDLLDQERGGGEAASGIPGVEIVSYLHEFAEKNTDVSDLAAAAGLILLLKFAGDNAGFLSLDVPRHMTFTALSMRMPDMIGTEELRDWADRILGSCGERERLPERIAIYCTDSSRDALLGNLFQMIEAYDMGRAEGRLSAVRILYQLLDFVSQRRKGPEADTQAIRLILSALQKAAEKAGDDMAEEAALRASFQGEGKEDAAAIREAMKSVLELGEAFKETEQKFDRLLGLL